MEMLFRCHTETGPELMVTWAGRALQATMHPMTNAMLTNRKVENRLMFIRLDINPQANETHGSSQNFPIFTSGSGYQQAQGHPLNYLRMFMRISHQRTTYAALLPAIFLVLMLSLGTSLFAQSTTGNIRGTVISADDGIPLPDVEITVILKAGPVHNALSKTDGSFAFLDLKPGKYKVTAALVGFKTAKQTVFVTEGRTLVLDIGLKLSE